MKIISRWLTRPLMALVLLYCLLLTAYSPRSQESAMESVLNACAQYSTHVNQSKMNAGDAAVYLAEHMQAVDTRDCPQDFQQAFQAHILAWRAAATALANNSPVYQHFISTVSDVTGNPTLVGQARLKASLATQRINESYQALVSIAIHDGVKVPVSFVHM